jgi:hypothetical protein
VVSSPLAPLRKCTDSPLREMLIASQFVRTSTLSQALNVCSFKDQQARFLGITPPEMWCGSLQFAYDTYGPRSTMMISASSSSLRRRAAGHSTNDDDLHDCSCRCIKRLWLTMSVGSPCLMTCSCRT